MLLDNIDMKIPNDLFVKSAKISHSNDKLILNLCNGDHVDIDLTNLGNEYNYSGSGLDFDGDVSRVLTVKSDKSSGFLSSCIGCVHIKKINNTVGNLDGYSKYCDLYCDFVKSCKSKRTYYDFD